MRLQIPHGWTISDNKFYDIDAIVDDNGNIVNWDEGFTEDVLWIQENIFKDSEFETPKVDCFDIDLSYLKGYYLAKLKFTTKTETHEIDTIKSIDRFEIRNKIESWLINISNNYHEFKSKMREIY